MCGRCGSRPCPCHTTPGASRCVVCDPVNPENKAEVQMVGEMLRPGKDDPDYVDVYRSRLYV